MVVAGCTESEDDGGKTSNKIVWICSIETFVLMVILPLGSLKRAPLNRSAEISTALHSSVGVTRNQRVADTNTKNYVKV